MNDISIHALLAESDVLILSPAKAPCISIHALLAESDRVEETLAPKLNQFLSTLSLRRATMLLRDSTGRSVISIHALLAESDHPNMSGHPHNTNFYPRSPCGERL